MKRRTYLLVMFILTMSFTFGGMYVQAKTLETQKVSIYVQQGKKYSIKTILSNLVNEDTRYESIKDQIKNKKVKWTVKPNQIKLKKQNVTVKKVGTYKLTGKTKDTKYVISLITKAKKMDKVPDKATKFYIRKGFDKGVECSDPNIVKALADVFTRSDYRFDLHNSNHFSEGWLYWIEFYSSDGKMIRRYRTCGKYFSYNSVMYKLNNKVNIEEYLNTLYPSLI